MKNFHLLPFFIIGLFMTSISLAQDTFYKGYMINKERDTIPIEIEQIDKENTPDYFRFRYEGEQEVYTTKEVKLKEIGFDAGRKFIFQVTEIDRYFTKDLGKLSGSRALVTKAEELFLELIADGEIRLAKYKKGDLERFYYQNESERFVLLIQNYYVVNEKLMENDTYRFQLKNLVSEANFENSKFNKVSYKESSILELIKDYYIATNQEVPFLNLNKNNTRISELISFSVRPGLRINSMDVDDGRDGDENVDFGTKLGFRLGVQIELELYNLNNWSLLFEPTLQQFKADENIQNTKVFIDYYSVELAIGARYYFLNREDSRLFANANFVYDLPVKTDFNVDVLPRTPATNLQESLGFNVGLGYQLNQKMSLELQYNGTRDIINEFFSFSSEYQGLSLIFGYTFF